MAKKITKYHGERDSPFFRLRSRSKLSALLFSSEKKLKLLASDEELYFDFQKPKSDGSFRKISAPREDLKKVQTRIATLLARIAPPDYLFAPVAGRSYVDNARRHAGANSIHLLDIEDFFPSCSANRIIWFFSKRMECSLDVAVILRGLVCKNDSLPQGSPCSPILAYLCYIDMWAEIEKITTAANCTLSIYADDLTISGALVPEEVIWKIKKTLVKYRHRYKVSKERRRHLKSAEITGVILSRDKLLAPNRQLKKLHDVRQELGKTKSLSHQSLLKAQLRGRAAQLNQIAAGNKQ